MGAVGFQQHCAARFASAPDRGAGTYEAVHRAFEWLPLAAIVADAVLVLHGGLGDGSWTIDDLRLVERPVADDINAQKCVREALWSDPTDSDADMQRGVHFRGERGPGIPTFGPDVTRAFCTREGIQLVVRSHQFVREGVKFMHGGRLATLFSARNYFEAHLNDSALLLVAADESGALRVRTKTLAHRMAQQTHEQSRPLGELLGQLSVGGASMGGGLASISAGLDNVTVR